MNKLQIKIWLTAFLCCLAMGLAGCDHQAGFYVEQEDTAEDTILSAESIENGDENTIIVDEKSNDKSETPQEIPEEELIYVQVSGAVVHPGVYQLPAGSRVFEAVELAGGMTEDADQSAVNQAQVLSDGQMIYLYTVGEEPIDIPLGQMSWEEDDGRVNLNTATAEELMTLPGIGQSKADMIIAYREEQGVYEKIEDIMNIQGIKEGVFRNIKDHIRVD